MAPFGVFFETQDLPAPVIVGAEIHTETQSNKARRHFAEGSRREAIKTKHKNESISTEAEGTQQYHYIRKKHHRKAVKCIKYARPISKCSEMIVR